MLQISLHTPLCALRIAAAVTKTKSVGLTSPHLYQENGKVQSSEHKTCFLSCLSASPSANTSISSAGLAKNSA